MAVRNPNPYDGAGNSILSRARAFDRNVAPNTISPGRTVATRSGGMLSSIVIQAVQLICRSSSILNLVVRIHFGRF